MPNTYFYRAGYFVFLVLIILPTSAVSEEDTFSGVSSCASTVCHGGPAPKPDGVVLQNEYTTWFRHDAHAKAFETLLGKESKIIAKHLGIEHPESANECLQCHATNVPESQRGKRFRLSDGVGCESCHGPSGTYLKSHTQKGRSHKDNIKDGMYDLVTLTNRAKVCSECHVGNDLQHIDHRLIGAGHPRLSFELDTYSIVQPRHWDVDQDYVERKEKYESPKAWLVGQAYRSKEMLLALQSESRSKYGVMPELSNYYCYSCHHDLSKEEWKTRSYNGRPGELRLNISSLKVVSLALQSLDSSLASALSRDLSLLHDAHIKGLDRALLRRMVSLLEDKIIPYFLSLEYTKERSELLLRSLISYSAENEFLPYEVAEQCAMGASALITHIDPSGERYKKQLANLYESLRNEKEFQPEEFTKAAISFQTFLNHK
jgi:hypothetical protein